MRRLAREPTTQAPLTLPLYWSDSRYTTLYLLVLAPRTQGHQAWILHTTAAMLPATRLIVCFSFFLFFPAPSLLGKLCNQATDLRQHTACKVLRLLCNFATVEILELPRYV